MQSFTSSDAEKFREQLEVRARIHFRSSHIVVRVQQDGAEVWMASVHVRGSSGDAVSDLLSDASIAGTGTTVEQALDELADQLDRLEAALLSDERGG